MRAPRSSRLLKPQVKEVSQVDLRQFVDSYMRAFNAHDEDRIRSFYADDVVFEAPGDVRLVGAEATVDYAMEWLRAFPDGQLRSEIDILSEDWIVQRFVFEGTHEETLMGPTGEIPPTHRRLEGRGVDLIRVEDGKISEEYLVFDQLDVLSQLGLSPELAARA
jgi:steroid delta-isomerase-like uncharacterized protein